MPALVLAGLAKGIGEGLWQGAVFHCFGGFFDVIFKSYELDLDAVFVCAAAVVVDGKQDIATAGIAVFGFTDGADIDSMTVVGLQLALGFCFALGLNAGQDAVIGFVGVTEAHDVGVGILHDAYEAFFFAVLEEVFVDTARAAMDEQKVELVIV